MQRIFTHIMWLLITILALNVSSAIVAMQEPQVSKCLLEKYLTRITIDGETIEQMKEIDYLLQNNISERTLKTAMSIEAMFDPEGNREVDVLPEGVMGEIRMAIAVQYIPYYLVSMSLVQPGRNRFELYLSHKDCKRLIREKQEAWRDAKRIMPEVYPDLKRILFSRIRGQAGYTEE